MFSGKFFFNEEKKIFFFSPIIQKIYRSMVTMSLNPGDSLIHLTCDETATGFRLFRSFFFSLVFFFFFKGQETFSIFNISFNIFILFTRWAATWFYESPDLEFKDFCQILYKNLRIFYSFWFSTFLKFILDFFP